MADARAVTIKGSPDVEAVDVAVDAGVPASAAAASRADEQG